ncbi:MAG TPA: hypothetical protein VGQ42_10405 [Candidatus Dormibacteraeota bacterium]|jgi:hypothetical protein|nr:hypothetical protein [Candidatus Dormibacteraeota bacterium]
MAPTHGSGHARALQRHRRISGIVAALSVLLLVAAGSTAARAQTVDSDTFVVSGILNANPPVTTAPEQTGTMTLTDDCVAVSIDTGSTDATADANAGCITASGPYTSLNCAVVTATMTGTLTGLPKAGTSTTLDTYNVSFTLTIVGAVGIVYGTASDTGSTAFGTIAGSFLAPTSDTCATGGIANWGFDGPLTTTA